MTRKMTTNRAEELGFFSIDKRALASFRSTSHRVGSPGKMWKFTSRHPADIDFALIARDLSIKNPIAVVAADDAGPDDIVWVVVHYKMTLKGEITGNSINHLPSPAGRIWPCRGPNDYTVVSVLKKDVDRIRRWARDVKKADWPDGEVHRMKVTLPEV